MELRERALRALGFDFAYADGNNSDAWRNPDGEYIRATVFKVPSETKLIGMLLLELEKLPCLGDFKFDGSLGGTQPISVTLYGRNTIIGCTHLEALVLAVEAAKEGK